MNLVLLLLVTANAAAVDRTLTGPNTNEENTADVENTKMPGVGDRSHTNSGSNNNNDKINTEITQETNKKENKEENKTTNSYNVIIPIIILIAVIIGVFVILMKKGYLQWPHYPAAELPIDEPDVLEQIEVPAPNPPTKSVLVLGEKQSGKSALCNVLAGKEAESDEFPVGRDKTKTCTVKEVSFKNSESESLTINLIDTVGLEGGENRELDKNNLNILRKELIQHCEYIDMLIITLDGKPSRISKSFRSILESVKVMFGKDFWKQTVIIFTHVKMEEEEIEDRKQRNNNKTDDEIARDKIDVMGKEYFPKIEDVKYLFINSFLDVENNDAHERDAFKNSKDELWKILDRSDIKIETKQIREV